MLRAFRLLFRVLLAPMSAMGGFSTQLFVDSDPQFGYSEDLARCCAWGLCVFTRTILMDIPEGDSSEQAKGR